MMPPTRIPVTCDCCGTCGLATILSDVDRVQVEIRARRHGVWHALTLDMAALAALDETQYRVPVGHVSLPSPE